MSVNPDNYTLRQKQSAFALCLAKLITWVYQHPGWEVTFAEGYVGDTDARDGDHDGPHMKGGTHYLRIGQDLNLFIDGEWIRGHHQAWDAIGGYWLSLHPLARWGGTFKSRDWNHVSFEHQGKS
jgi:hypothetical protein